MLSCKNQRIIGCRDGKILAEVELRGLSSDEKPVGEYENIILVNGSVFYEMDTATEVRAERQTTIS